MLKLTLPDIGKLRISSQQLQDTKFQSAQQMVSWFGAVQGQEYALTKWGLGLRLAHLHEKDIEAELTEGRILRTHLLRPTWHFVSANDIHWMLKLTAPRVNQANSFMYRQTELDNKIFNRSNKIIAESLQGKNYLTRDEINEILKKNKIIAEGPRLAYIMMRAELDGIICSGPRKGKQFTYALIEERAGPGKAFNKEESLKELSKRYFFSRGPATINDYSTWSGLTVAECRQGIEMIQSKLSKQLLEGKEYYFKKGITIKESTPRILLLPIYDEFIMGYKDRSAYFEFRKKIKPEPAVKHNNMIVYDGQIIGSWKPTNFSRQSPVDICAFKKPTSVQQKLYQQAIVHFCEFNK